MMCGLWVFLLSMYIEGSEDLVIVVGNLKILNLHFQIFRIFTVYFRFVQQYISKMRIHIFASFEDLVGNFFDWLLTPRCTY